MKMRSLALSAAISFWPVQGSMALDTAQQTGNGGTPVLLELFTSEGCSSCPPADRLLRQLDHDQSLAGADLIVLSEHVDYWNNGGWRDPYSSAEFSNRQRNYSERLNSDVYTPQLVIDGSAEVVGSNRSDIQRAVRSSLQKPKIGTEIEAKREGGHLDVHVKVDALSNDEKANVFLVLAADQAESHVQGGENAGRDLVHVAVAQSFRNVGALSNDSGLERHLTVPLSGISDSQHLRVVLIVQGNSGGVLGAGETRL